jgi:NAD(P)-dependent dehydrogenase (short-subunit alcohol dehydrogenase family)
MQATQPVALVTGVSSGIGSATARALAGRGYRVFGSVRATRGELPAGVEPVVLDVRDEASIESAVRHVRDTAGGIDLLVNNAGGTIMGAVEETSLAQAKALFDTNFFGAFRVAQAVLPAMRARGHGRIIFMSSVVGFLPAPFMGFYAASKHAMEALAESLDHETRGFGVRVVLVEPGFMRTRIDANSVQAERPVDAYRAARERVSEVIRRSVEAGEDPDIVAQAVVRAATEERPRLRYPVGKKASTLALLRSLVPARLFDGALRRDFRLDG